MRFYTAHLKARRAPTLVPEGFSWGALIFGPVWLLVHGAWVFAAALFVLYIALGFVPGAAGAVLEFAVAITSGVYGHDLRRWSLAIAGWSLAAVVAGRNEDAAFARLLTLRPELMTLAAGQV